MNEKRFIQLINLYIDGEISPEELEELETEVSQDARRRETYYSYCRLQRASQVVYRKLGSALTETVDLKKYQILARDSSRCLRRGVLYSAGALAAACLTVVAAVSVFHDAQWGPSRGSHSQETTYGAVEVFEPGTSQRRSQRAHLATVDQSEPFFFAGRPTSIHSSERTEFLDPARAESHDPFRLSARPQVWDEFGPNASPRVIRGDSSFDATPELASFQFQR